MDIPNISQHFPTFSQELTFADFLELVRTWEWRGPGGRWASGFEANQAARAHRNGNRMGLTQFTTMWCIPNWSKSGIDKLKEFYNDVIYYKSQIGGRNIGFKV